MKNDREFKFLLDKIKRNRSIDFSRYRIQVLSHRVQSRLDLTGCKTFWDYILLLNKDPAEYDRLIEHLTIKVSAFFRDPVVFDLLEDVIIPEIVRQKKIGNEKQIRAWSCGAAFGQEAYSIAILLSDILGAGIGGFDLSVLATDIDRRALERARWGSYSKKALRTMDAHLLFKFFTRFDDRYVVNERARSMVTFEHHDIASGVPKSGMDLVLCRNLLIYLEREHQEKVLGNILAAMNPGAFLILGKTESIPFALTDCFLVLDLNERIYRKC